MMQHLVPLEFVIVVLAIYCLVGAAYYGVAAAIFLMRRASETGEHISQAEDMPKKRFIIIIPAHNEEKVLPGLLKSIAEVDYPRSCYKVCVICDNCSDDTERLATEAGALVYKRVDTDKCGKGYALALALERVDLGAYELALMTDADTIVDKHILKYLNIKFEDNRVQVVQCYNGVMNPEESSLTRLLDVARALEHIYMAGRAYMGLTVPLIGNGMCFRTPILNQYPWRCVSIAEDLEYFCVLAEKGVKIAYSSTAKVLLKEERKLAHARTQRERWARGRFRLLKKYILRIMWEGLRRRDFKRMEMAMILLVPNPSLLLNVLAVILISNLIVHVSGLTVAIISICIAFLLIYFLSAFVLIKCDMAKIIAMCMVPIFLCWKGAIDIRALVGGKCDQWLKTERH